MTKHERFDPQVIATTLMGIIQETFKTICNWDVTEEPTFYDKDIIEYNSRMRVFGLEKFNDITFLSAIYYYTDQKKFKDHDPCGTLVLYIRDEIARKIVKVLENKGIMNDSDTDSDSDMDAVILDNCGEFCNMVAGNFKNELTNLGYHDLVMSAPFNYKNDIPEGVMFPYDEYKSYEICFDLFGKKSLIVSIVLGEIPLA